MYTESDVLEYVNEEDVKFVRLAFFDLRGVQKNISIMASQLSRAFENGVSFDASAIFGFESPEKSDLFLYPDPTTLSVLPWRPNTGKVVRMFCTIKHADGSPYKKDCRTILKNAVKMAKEEYGLEFNFGTEIEFYLFKLWILRQMIRAKIFAAKSVLLLSRWAFSQKQVITKKDLGRTKLTSIMPMPLQLQIMPQPLSGL